MMEQKTYEGGVLREKREALGLSLRDVYYKTRIPIQYVQAIESGDFERFPAACYAAGFLRSYCRLLEMDAEPFVQAYEAHLTPMPRHFARLTSDYYQRVAQRHWPDLVAWLAVCALVALGWFAYQAVVQPSTITGEKAQVEAAPAGLAVPALPDLRSGSEP